MKSLYLTAAVVFAAAPAFAESHGRSYDAAVTYGVRPAYVVSQMADGALKDKLMSCMAQTPKTSKFSIGHRGAAMMFPEHTAESYRAAAAQGAGIIECDVTFTADKQLVCRHAQNDLHTTTNIVATDLASKCTTPFAAASGDAKASAECRTSDLTLDEFKSLKPKMDAANSAATTAADYLGGTANWRTDLYAGNAHIMTHAESIALIDSLGADFTPELKAASVDMPYDGMTQADYAQAMIDEYKAAGIDPSRVWAQSFNLDDIKYWIANEPEFGKQAVYLDDRYEASDDDEGLIDHMDAATFKPTMAELKEMGVNYIAPPMWMLVTLDETGKIVPSVYTKEAEAAGLKIITWTLERSGPLATGGGWYFQSIKDATNNDGVYYELLDVLAQDVKIEGIFSDWPATVTYYANCMGL
ncbi:glycerophosphodiester phosphodiesterase family protein [Pseudoprimorskyibacter insulae]|uniref:glycerophosphodiester phosphodiesterase n=1 Tax=Pseudoprimorskyibacter insulae TaxID=1695997 RepID=A0A2R8AWQ5_9RHOB|nr:glycerophosphodiester phosphodiesterase family protein [Pseudoprimorskyibacter insulae]SPF80463.1 Glycerophosphodiester phosphodiesterase, periplasmic [Pseudoprimorskyibacter insulae]